MNTFRFPRLLLALALVGLLAGGRLADAAEFGPRGPSALINPIVVNTFSDDFTANGLCSLREAAESVRQAASVGGCVYPAVGLRVIELAAGTYTLTRSGTITGGSLNLKGNVIVAGAGMTQTIVKQTIGGERVFEVDTSRLGTVTLRDLAITGGNGSEGGGVLNNDTVVLDSVRVFSNTASGGGGIANSTFSTMTIQSSLIDTNHAAQGGGIRNSGNLNMKASAVASNTASSAGGGIASDGSTTLVNTTVISNSAGSGLGGGIRHNSAGPLRLRNSTVARNASGNVGAGLHLSIGDPSVMVLENTIVAENTQTGIGRSDCSGSIGQALYSLIGAGGCGFAAVFENKIGTPGVPITPQFGTLGYVAGMIPYLPLLANSPAVNRGDILDCIGTADAAPTTDQLGAARIVEGRCDMGAVEFTGVASPPQTPTPTPTPPPSASSAVPINTFSDDLAQNGLCSLREAAESVRQGVSVGGCALGAGPRHVFTLLAGTYLLTRSGQITGGGLNLTGTIDIVGAGAGQTLIQQSAPSSRVIEVDGGTILLQDLTVTGGANAVGLDGGGIKNFGVLTLKRVELKNNSTNVSGGGLSNDGVATVISTTIRENHAGTGGGIRNGGTLFARDSSIFWNNADIAGGMENRGEAELVNTSVISNYGVGIGGVHVPAFGRLRLSNATIARNVAGAGGGGLNIEALTDITLTNSIVAENRLSNGIKSDCDAEDDTARIDVMLFSILAEPNGRFCLPKFSFFNQVGDGITVTASFGPFVAGANPRLPLAFNSPAIDVGDPNGCRTQAGDTLTKDQAGTTRPVGGRCDLGAVEFNGPPPTRTFMPSIRR
ncbi:MAG: choice-of-anchor Q domain-containing protein [Thermoflexales bacterium]